MYSIVYKKDAPKKKKVKTIRLKIMTNFVERVTVPPVGSSLRSGDFVLTDDKKVLLKPQAAFFYFCCLNF